MPVRNTAQILKATADENLRRVGTSLVELEDRLDRVDSAVISVTGSASSTSAITVSSPTGLTVSGAVQDGQLAITISGALPTDANLAGLQFILEKPVLGAIPGDILADVWEGQYAGDGSAFSETFKVDLPDSSEIGKWVIYALPFSDAARNPFVRLTQLTPPLPADVTPFAALDVGTVLTVSGSELGDVSITGTPTVTPDGFGNLIVDVQYIPPYLPGPVLAIGDFAGVTPYVELANGKVTGFARQPYLGNGLASAPDNYGSVSIRIPMPSAQTIYVQLCSYSSTRELPFRPHGVAPTSRWVAIAVDSSTIQSGKAQQVSAFDVQVESQIAGGDTSGQQERRYKYIFNPPSDSKWKEVWIHRVACDSSFTPVTGGVSGYVCKTNTHPDYSGWFGMPQAIEYWWFRAYSVNQAGELNTVSPPSVFVTLTPSGELVNAATSITEAMLADLAVAARALADNVVQTRHYAPLSIGSAAIGLAAINDANIANLRLDKLTAAPGAAYIDAATSIRFTAGGYYSEIAAGGFSSNGPIIGTNTVNTLTSFNGPAINLATNTIILNGSGATFNTPLTLGTGQPSNWRATLGVYSAAEVDAIIAALPGGSAAVTSVFGRTGAVTASSGDYSAHYAPTVHNHDSAYAPLEYYAGQTVNAQLYYLTSDLDAGASGSFDPTAITSVTVVNGRITAWS
jgi:hypothetical protein